MKEYVKPELFCESFVLSQHIALCAFDLNASLNVCVAYGDDEFNLGGVNLYNKTNNSACTVDPIDFPCFCYTNGTNGQNLFNS